MKQIPRVFLLIFLFVLATSARLLPLYQGDQKVKANVVTRGESSIKKAEEDHPNLLMGLEDCDDDDDDDDDEDCVKRRVIAETHLDYIYTQHLKPKGLP